MPSIDTLPCTAQDVNSLKFEDMVDKIILLSHPETLITGQAAMEVNAFLAHAAIRMAKVLSNSRLAGNVLCC